MKLDELKKRIEEIKEIKDDPENAHIKADALYIDVLQSIADNTCENAVDMAREALTVEGIDFPRWFA